MTTYNCGKYIRDSINSILNQTFKEFEFVIIDDGSSDNTIQVIKSINDSRIRFESIEHIGLSRAANYGLTIAKYDWIARMDADDIAHPDRLEKQIKLINDNYRQIISSCCAYFNGKKIKYVVENPNDDLQIKNKLKLHSVISHQSSLYNRRFILNELGGYSENLSAFVDYDLWLRAMSKAKFSEVTEVLVFARYRKDSVSNSKLYNKNHLFYQVQKNNLELSSHTDQENIVNGWREYFYGDKKLARYYWHQVNLGSFDYRIVMAYILSLLPKSVLNWFKQKRFRLRLKYLIQRFTLYKGLDKEFNKILREVS